MKGGIRRCHNVLHLHSSRPADLPSGGIHSQAGGSLHVIGEDIALVARVGDKEVDASSVLIHNVQVASQPIPGQAHGQS